MQKSMHAAVVEAFKKPLVLREMPVPEVGRNQEGERVGVPWLYSACGHCEYRLSAWETVCPEAQFGGYTRNGSFAEYILADPDYVAHIPKGLTPQAAAPIICAGVTTYKGIKQTGARAGDWIAISGIGGLGHLAIQYSKIMGFQIVAIDIAYDKLALAKHLDADVTVNAKNGDLVAERITIRGSFVGTRQDIAEALAFAADGRELVPLAGRVVLDFAKDPPASKSVSAKQRVPVAG